MSVLWIKYSASALFSAWFVGVMAALALLSLIPVLIKRKKYSADLRGALDEGEGLQEYYAPMLLSGFCILMTMINLFA